LASLYASLVFGDGKGFNPYAPYPDEGGFREARISISTLEKKLSEHSERLDQFAEKHQSVEAAHLHYLADRMINARLESAMQLLNIQTQMRDPDDYHFVSLLRNVEFSLLSADCRRATIAIDARLQNGKIKGAFLTSEAKSFRSTLEELCDSFAAAASDR
jgi:hypothetical protein